MIFSHVIFFKYLTNFWGGHWGGQPVFGVAMATPGHPSEPPLTVESQKREETPLIKVITVYVNHVNLFKQIR